MTTTKHNHDLHFFSFETEHEASNPRLPYHHGPRGQDNDQAGGLLERRHRQKSRFSLSKNPKESAAQLKRS